MPMNINEHKFQQGLMMPQKLSEWQCSSQLRDVMKKLALGKWKVESQRPRDELTWQRTLVWTQINLKSTGILAKAFADLAGHERQQGSMSRNADE